MAKGGVFYLVEGGVDGPQLGQPAVRHVAHGVRSGEDCYRLEEEEREYLLYVIFMSFHIAISLMKHSFST